MAGLTNQGVFVEKISPFLKYKFKEIIRQYGDDSKEYHALYLQYIKQDIEDSSNRESNNRHWEADLHVSDDIGQIRGVERLYKRSMVIEPTMICAAHCRYCLRANYNIFTLSDSELVTIAKYCGRDEVKDDVNELLITGGDPLIIPAKLSFFIESVVKHASNIRRIRIGSRLPLHEPSRIDNNVYDIISRFSERLCFEIGIQVNHPVELFPEVIEVLNKIKAYGIPIYAQNVLLKGVNDDIDTLTALYQMLRSHGISPHYLFHSVPMRGMHHLRTSVIKGLTLIQELVNSGNVSGRAKPMYALMTDIGKIILYDGSIIETKNNMLLVQSKYNYRDRMQWNPNWDLPRNAHVDDEGFLRVWYLDGDDS